MQLLIQQVVVGIANGAIYASLALALVLIYRATHVLNFAQGEIGMFTTFVAWSLVTHHGFGYWPAFFLTLLIAFAGGVGIHRTVIRPLEGRDPLTVVMATIALLVILNGLASWIWGGESKILLSPFGNNTWDVGGVKISQQSVAVIGIVLATVTVLLLFFRYTRAGLALRASAINPEASRLHGVRVSWMLAIGWGLAAVLAAVSGLLAASSFFVFDPNFMQTILIYAFAAAVLGGIESPVGAVLGGLLIGVTVTLLGAYVNWIGSVLQLPVALALLLVVLLVRPGGIAGRVAVRRA